MTFIFFGSIVGAGALMGSEELFLRASYNQFYELSQYAAVPRAYGLVAFSVIGTGIYLAGLGTSVGLARKKFIEKAKKDGDTDAEARYSYPKMYAEGFSENARLFNCVQRGHQHALETYPIFISLTLLSGLRFPVTASAIALFWIYARSVWATGYSTGNPSNRYSHWAAYGIWSFIIAQLIGAGGTAVGMLGIA